MGAGKGGINQKASLRLSDSFYNNVCPRDPVRE